MRTAPVPGRAGRDACAAGRGPLGRRGHPSRSRGRIGTMLRWLTAGESHGRALVAICEGLPAGIEITTADIAAALARRRAGYGRGARMKFEQDEVEITGGIRHGRPLGTPSVLMPIPCAAWTRRRARPCGRRSTPPAWTGTRSAEWSR